MSDKSDSSDDEDYVPEDVAVSTGGESESDCDSENGKKRKIQNCREKLKRKHGEHTRDEETREEAMKSEIEEQKRKERLDSLWSSFKDNDRNTPVNLESTTSSVASTKGNIASSNEKKEESSETVTITKSYDFAGEEIKVSEEVSTSSKAGKEFLKRKDEEGLDMLIEKKPSIPAKRTSGLTSILSKLSKKPKMSTLEKSKLDWDKFKVQEGLTEELARNTKDGYLEKQAFLRQSDWREYELEREERMRNFKKHF